MLLAVFPDNVDSLRKVSGIAGCKLVLKGLRETTSNGMLFNHPIQLSNHLVGTLLIRQSQLHRLWRHRPILRKVGIEPYLNFPPARNSNQFVRDSHILLKLVYSTEAHERLMKQIQRFFEGQIVYLTQYVGNPLGDDS